MNYFDFMVNESRRQANVCLDRFQNSDPEPVEQKYVECDSCGKIVAEEYVKHCENCGHEGCVYCLPLDKEWRERFCGQECKDEWLEKGK